jgi:hypothetical protein
MTLASQSAPLSVRRCTTMQTLGRVAIIGGSVGVSILNIFLQAGALEAQKSVAYLSVYQLALFIPLVSVLGVIVASWLRRRALARLAAEGHSRAQSEAILSRHVDPPPVNWWILGGGLAFAWYP